MCTCDMTSVSIAPTNWPQYSISTSVSIVRDVTRSYVWHDSCVRATWLHPAHVSEVALMPTSVSKVRDVIPMCDMTCTWDMTSSSMCLGSSVVFIDDSVQGTWRDEFVHVTWLIIRVTWRVCAVGANSAWRDAFVCVDVKTSCCSRVRKFISTYKYMYIETHIYIYVYVYLFIYRKIYINKSIKIIFTHKYIYIDTHIHEYVYIYIYLCTDKSI